MNDCMSISTRRSTGWAITVHSDTIPPFDPDIMRHYSGIRETCPKTKKKHWQIALLSIQATWYQIKAIFPGAHVEFRGGTFEQNRIYCTLGKGLTPPDTTGIPGTEFEYGNRPRPGTRTDIDEAAAGMLAFGWAGVGDREIIKYHRGLEKLRVVRYVPEDCPKKVYWYWGASGKGKTRQVYAAAREMGRVYIAPSSGWVDNYDDQKVAIFDDYDGRPDIPDLLRLLDRYPYQAQCKGAHAWWTPEIIYITSSLHPSTYAGARWPELERRITKLYEVIEEVGV